MWTKFNRSEIYQMIISLTKSGILNMSEAENKTYRELQDIAQVVINSINYEKIRNSIGSR